ncbi:MFS general substrate transporter [Mycena filopes]|nr:MFS general substrate transporter [Mycena filopes]
MEVTAHMSERNSGSVESKSPGPRTGAQPTTLEVSADDVDTAATLVSGEHGELDAEEGLRVRRKVDRHILPLMCILYLIQFMDKTTLGNAAILGIIQKTHLTVNQYNWLGTVFYLSYLVFEFPQNLALQRFPVAKWTSINIFIWGVALCSHAACTSFGGLLAVRIILGMCEGSITAGFMIVTSMFYTRREQGLRVGYWFLMNGTAQILSGFLSFGTLHIRTKSFEPWQWLMIITGILTLIVAVLFWAFFPDSPTSAWFLTLEERIIVTRRLKVNQTGVENKHFKKEQLIEALADPKTWLFALLAALANIPNSLNNQASIIVASFGFTILQTTLLSCVFGVVALVSTWSAVILVAKTGSRTWVAVCFVVPNIIGAVLIITLPWTNKIGLLFAAWINGFVASAFIISIAWVSAVTAGHTKRVTTNAIMLSAYKCQRTIHAKYKPRDRVPWIIIIACYISCMVLLVMIRQLLVVENKRRDREALGEDKYDNVFMEKLTKDGSGMEKVKVEKEYLDLTDIQNREFRYVY